MKNVRLIRKDESAVSPVIATILMVAITVVLAAVLYVMVSGLISGPGTGPQAMGVTVTRSSDGVNWVLTVSSTPPAKAYASTTLTIFRTDGSVNRSATALANLDIAGEGCQLIQASPTATAVTVGDRILCRTSWYAVNTEYQISDGATILATGRLTS